MAPPGAPFSGEISRTSPLPPAGPGVPEGRPLFLGTFSLPSPSGRALTLGPWTAPGGALAIPCITSPELAACPTPLHRHCPSCCFQALKGCWHFPLAAGSGSGQESQAHRMAGDQEGSPESLKGHLLGGQNTEALREGRSILEAFQCLLPEARHGCPTHLKTG